MPIDQLAPFADAELVLRTLLAGQLDSSIHVVSATGPTLTMPIVLIRRIGGDTDRITDFATMMVSCLCATRPESNILAAQVQALILNATNTAVALDGSTALIDGASVTVADHPEPYENPDVREVTATFELRMRRPKLTD